MSGVVPLIAPGQAESYRSEFDPSFRIPFARIKSDIIAGELERRMWTWRFAAKQAGIGETAVYRILKGREYHVKLGTRRAVLAYTLAQLARALDLTLRDVVEAI